MRFVLLFFLLITCKFSAQIDTSKIKRDRAAPPFILSLKENTIQSFSMPYMKRIVLLCFWNSNVPASRAHIKKLERLAENYKTAQFSLAESFEVIAVAVQSDRKQWTEAIAMDSLKQVTHGVAVRGYQEDVCKRYGIMEVPTTLLIDESGIVRAINPRISEVESFLDAKKNSQPVRKSVSGTLAQSSDKAEPIRFCKVYLFNFYGDSLQKTTTSDKGTFIFSDVKINQDYVIKVDNKVNITTSDPIALYTSSGDYLMDGRTSNNGFEFAVPARSSNKLASGDSLSEINYLGQIDIIKHLTFFTNGKGLTPKDEQDLIAILKILVKNKNMNLEISTHTDARMDQVYAMELTKNQAETIKVFFEKKGIVASRIRMQPKGNSELRKICSGGIDCREEDHQLNRRVEFLIYRN